MHSPHMILKSTSVSLLFVFAISGLLMPGFDNAIGQDREPNKATLVVRADQAGPVINKNIYGQFAEHLGRLIYEGLWVGEDSPIPNTRGLRNDVVAALKERPSKSCTYLSCVGPAAASPMNIIGVMVLAHAISVRDDLMPVGVALILTRSAHMNSWTCARC